VKEAIMSSERSRVLGRRALLHAGATAAGAAVAAALVAPRPVLAADGNAVLVGGEYEASSRTRISQTAMADDAIVGVAKGGSGVSGQSTDGNGVFGSNTSQFGAGVFGTSDDGIGVVGSSSSDHLPGIYGSSVLRTGVVGLAGAGVLGTAPAKTGVYGVAGSGTSGDRGVHGAASTGRGVFGETATGVGGYFAATGSGIALQAAGRVKFSTCGVATISAGSKSKVVAPGVALTAASRVFATLQADPGNAATVQRVAVNAAADTFTVYLTAKASAGVAVAWFVIG
jgi:hypothetical protein